MLHIHLADQYRRGSSLLHRLDPRVKILGAVTFIAAASVLPAGAWVEFGLLFAGALLAARASGLGAGFALRRSFLALPFALAAITLPFTVPGQTIARVGGLTVSAEGTIRFTSLLIKSWLSIQPAILLSATTSFPDLLWGLRALRVPRPLVSILSFMYRYLFVLADEALRLMRARASRAAAAEGGGGGSLAWRGRVAGGMVGNLVLRAFERSERIYDAMVARGFRGELRALGTPRLTELDWNVFAAWSAYLAMTVLIAYVF